MKVFQIVACVLLGTAPLAAGELNNQITSQSRYYGVGWQSDGNHWSIEAIIDKTGGKVAYPSLECTGEWILTGQSEVILRYRETITDGIADCASRGEIELEQFSDGRLLYTWKETPETTDARAILLPVSGPRQTYMELLKLTLNNVEYDYLWPEFMQ
ncbi:MAG: hypothetical protein GXP03_11100 [Alphaproteobacteria bacterium]|nr:hypothetical protein [Alphaproteobacteria bacterium]